MGGWRYDDKDQVEFDFHGFDHEEAIGIVADVVRAAWERGYRFVSLSHGAGDVPTSGFWFGRGSIKRALYSMWNQRHFTEWAWFRRSRKHQTTATRIRLALRPNPKPINDPLPDFGRGYHSKT